MRKEFTYYLYSPCGNDTALVEGSNIGEQTKKILNDKIMSTHSNIEQVGFISLDKFKLDMAGGEFCGNATRSAAYHYLKGNKGEIRINVSNNIVMKAGVDENKRAWSEIPLYSGKDFINAIDNGIYEIIMNGIKYIILEKDISKQYLLDKKNIKANAMNILKEYKIRDAEAIGVIFIEDVNEKIKIHPVVWVKSINTLFYETACGSGTTAVAILQAVKHNKSQNLDIIQPSNQIITAKIILNKGIIESACILGNIKTDNCARRIMIDI